MELKEIKKDALYTIEFHSWTDKHDAHEKYVGCVLSARGWGLLLFLDNAGKLVHVYEQSVKEGLVTISEDNK